jgi:polynucleotide 5'-kinase involved in rRNA processing
MIDLEYLRLIEDCFKTQVVCPVGLSEDLFKMVEEAKEKKREEIRRNLEESRLKKIHGNKVKISFEPPKHEKRKNEIKERLRKKLEERKKFF